MGERLIPLVMSNLTTGVSPLLMQEIYITRRLWLLQLDTATLTTRSRLLVTEIPRETYWETSTGSSNPSSSRSELRTTGVQSFTTPTCTNIHWLSESTVLIPISVMAWNPSGAGESAWTSEYRALTLVHVSERRLKWVFGSPWT